MKSPTASVSAPASTSVPPTGAARPGLSRDAIIEVARRLLREIGFDKMSLRRLASELGVTAPALYAHVRDKGDLLAALAETGFGELVERFDAITATDPIERLRQQSLAYVNFAVADPDLFRIMFMFRPAAIEVPGLDNELPAANDAFDRARSTLTEAMASGAIHSDHDADLVSLVLWTVTHGIANVVLLGVTVDTAERLGLVNSVLDITLQGLAQPPG